MNNKSIRKSRISDHLGRGLTYVASSISILVLGAIVVFILINGLPLFGLNLFVGKSENISETLMFDEVSNTISFDLKGVDPEKGLYGSRRYGVIIKDGKDFEGTPIIIIDYIHEDSPLKNGKRLDYKEEQNDSFVPLKVGDTLSSKGGGILLWDDNGGYINARYSDGAKKIAEALEITNKIGSLPVTILGTGVKGSIITTMYLIILTLVIAVPIGVASALYLHEIAPQNFVTNILRSFVDMLTGIPSIIYGLMGAALFIPLTQKLFGDKITGGNLISGALTLSVIVLPVIIKATESALDVVPKDYKLASLALGANKVQTTFKIMLPNAVPGILSAVLLAIGRVMGESAALIYAIGTVIKDDINIFGNGTSIAVHIWASMAGDNPNFGLASSMAIIILIVVLVLNFAVKIVTKRFVNKFN